MLNTHSSIRSSSTWPSKCAGQERAPCEHRVNVDGDCGGSQHARLQADVDAVVAHPVRSPLEDGQAGCVGLRHLRMAIPCNQLQGLGDSQVVAQPHRRPADTDPELAVTSA